jgi:dolichol-phosphate mannosyltransferase
MNDLLQGSVVASGVLLVQLPAVSMLLYRLRKSVFRRPPLPPSESDPATAGEISVLVPTLNEGERIQPCLQGLQQQGPEVAEVVVIDSRSQDDTVAKVLAMQDQDPRFRVITDDPLPGGWVGRPWALHTGYLHSDPESTWILGIDADTRPQPGLAASLLRVATTEAFDVITLAPRFLLEHWGEAWLQPALLVTLIYRFGAAGDPMPPHRILANGQCFLARKSVLDQVQGYTSARASFCDDVTLVRHLATQGYKVGFLDGSRLLQVRMYTSLAETWREWGRSLDLKDASTPWHTWGDWLFLLAVQGFPLPILLLLLSLQAWQSASLSVLVCLGLNAGLVIFRWGLCLGIAGSYVHRPWTFWLSPLADPLAVLRIGLSALSQPRSWRGRNYDQFSTQDIASS